MLVKVWHHANVVEGGVVAARSYGQVAEVRHEGVTFPSKEEFDFHFAKAARVESGPRAYSKGMRGPQLQFFLVADGVEVK